jgi:pyrophosphatase PpaX
MSSNINCILFDLDGTLIDTSQLIIDSYQYTLKKHLNIEVPSSEIALTMGRPLVEILGSYSQKQQAEMVRTYREYNEARHDAATSLIPGVMETLEALTEEGITLGVVTGKRRQLAMRGMQLFGIDAYMQAIVTPEDTMLHKPNPEPILKALELLEQSPEETIMVGDSPVDLQTAHSAGTLSAAVLWSVAPRKQLLAARPDFLLHQMTELIDICLVPKRAHA